MIDDTLMSLWQKKKMVSHCQQQNCPAVLTPPCATNNHVFVNHPRLCRPWEPYHLPRTGLRSAFTQTCVYSQWGESWLISCPLFKQNLRLWQERVNIYCTHCISGDVSILCGMFSETVFLLLTELTRMRRYKGEIKNTWNSFLCWLIWRDETVTWTLFSQSQSPLTQTLLVPAFWWLMQGDVWSTTKMQVPIHLVCRTTSRGSTGRRSWGQTASPLDATTGKSKSAWKTTGMSVLPKNQHLDQRVCIWKKKMASLLYKRGELIIKFMHHPTKSSTSALGQDF